jgi:predicted membrane-bound dolichyl-phosphate-mannose-protein mannosyltransferase
MNPEHPPLGKYIIALSMALCGDRPVCWRLPGAVEVGLVPIMFMVGFISVRGDRRKKVALLLAGVVSALAFYSDLSVRYESAVAMLDIHQAFFEALSLILLFRGSILWGLVGLGLAGSVKYSGFFLLPAFWAYIGLYESSLKRRLYLFVASLVVPLSLLLLLNVPYIVHFGFNWWWENSVVGAIRWETTSRPPGPPTSTPFQWFINANPFYFNYNVMIGGVVTPSLYVGAIVLGALNIIVGIPSNRTRGVGSLAFYSIVGMYLLLYLMGNKTLYSFYVVQVAPAMALTYSDFVLNVLGEDGFED